MVELLRRETGDRGQCQDVGVMRVPITNDGPLLGSVFGHMTLDGESQIRHGIVDCGGRLLACANRLAGGSRGFELELTEWGWTAIGAVVQALDFEQNSVVFGLELTPGWSFHPERQSEQSWIVASWIDADCLHSIHHEAMESVYTHETICHSPTEAVAAVNQDADALISLAISHPVGHWTGMTKD
jgi:hypothetical protein